ncbi:antitoxin [Streptomyces sp. NRRL F-5123]|uniref:antitoxin n=1 Tax=Streptomyces sp. NRRL F-5123 TaxID=1463856 RepID=UPI000694E483|nr:antitoxin [Streptomyces sp. NRRL F-5123]
MSFMDTLKDKLGMAKGKAGGLARQHGDKIESGIDKAAQVADSKTGGKYSDKISSGAGKAKGAAQNLSGKGDRGGQADQSGQSGQS